MQVTLNNGLPMTSVGFGTAGLGEQTVPAMLEALLAGYTLFDTAQVSLQLTTGLTNCCLTQHI